MCVTLIWDNV